jgi:hypothetical protein
MRVIITGLLLAAAFASTANAEPTASEMRAYCRPVLARVGPDGQLSTAPNTFEVGLCLGAFQTLSKAISLDALDARERRLFRVCPPTDLSIIQYIQIFARFVDKLLDAPKEVRDEWFIVALLALQNAFPCPLT